MNALKRISLKGVMQISKINDSHIDKLKAAPKYLTRFSTRSKNSKDFLSAKQYDNNIKTFYKDIKENTDIRNSRSVKSELQVIRTDGRKGYNDYRIPQEFEEEIYKNELYSPSRSSNRSVTVLPVRDQQFSVLSSNTIFNYRLGTQPNSSHILTASTFEELSTSDPISFEKPSHSEYDKGNAATIPTSTSIPEIIVKNYGFYSASKFEEYGGDQNWHKDNLIGVPIKSKGKRTAPRDEKNIKNLPETCTVLSTQNGCRVYVVGVNHVSVKSQVDVATVIQEVQPDIVVLEMDKDRAKKKFYILIMTQTTGVHAERP